MNADRMFQNISFSTGQGAHRYQAVRLVARLPASQVVQAEQDQALLLPVRPPASDSRDLEPTLEPPAALQEARVSPRLWDVLAGEPCTIQLEELRVPAARVQEHRLAVLAVFQMKIYHLISSDSFNGVINIGIILTAERDLDG
jgi:hypothetical protein